MQPQTLGVPPPPQVCGDAQLEQVYVPPQPLGTEPHFPAQAVAIGVGVQPQTLGVPPPPQVCGAVHVEQV